MLQEIHETSVSAFAVRFFSETKTMPNYWNKLQALFLVEELQYKRDHKLFGTGETSVPEIG
jgi:hypothetical protein